MKTFVRFERGRDDVIGPTLGPFEWVQLTYSTLRVGLEGNDDQEIAYYEGDWFLTGTDEFFSDVVIFAAEAASKE